MSEMSIDAMCGDLAWDAGFHWLQPKRAALPSTGGGLSRRVEHLLLNTTMSYADIVATVRDEFPTCSTTTKSVASVACVMRKKGRSVPLRLKLNVVG